MASQCCFGFRNFAGSGKRIRANRGSAGSAYYSLVYFCSSGRLPPTRCAPGLRPPPVQQRLAGENASSLSVGSLDAMSLRKRRSGTMRISSWPSVSLPWSHALGVGVRPSRPSGLPACTTKLRTNVIISDAHSHWSNRARMGPDEHSVVYSLHEDSAKPSYAVPTGMTTRLKTAPSPSAVERLSMILSHIGSRPEVLGFRAGFGRWYHSVACPHTAHQGHSLLSPWRTRPLFAPTNPVLRWRKRTLNISGFTGECNWSRDQSWLQGCGTRPWRK